MPSDRYTLKDFVSLLYKQRATGDYEIEFLFEGSRKVVSFETNALAFACITSLDGQHTAKEIAQANGIDVSEVEGLIARLTLENIIGITMYSEVVPEKGRFARQENFFASFERQGLSRRDMQERLARSTVLILGLGGIGSWLCDSLVRSGVGELILVDPDVVEEQNLSHQSTWDMGSIGTTKVDALAIHCKSINPNVRVRVHQRKIKAPNDLTAILQESPVQLVINCSDEPDTETTNSIVSLSCFSMCITHILCGGYEGHASSIGQTVIPYQTACWQCYVEGGVHENLTRGFTHYPISQVEKEGGTLAPIAAITANIHALEIIRVLSGYESPMMLNRKGEYNFRRQQMKFISIPRFLECSLCSTAISKRS